MERTRRETEWGRQCLRRKGKTKKPYTFQFLNVKLSWQSEREKIEVAKQ